ncbi:MAG TPA: glycosyltransferase family 4 protein [Acidimicrobiales bacterium]|nr:glycosyltransferase family 4 protein [Acidimicrobiales bacterium]
MRVVLVSPYALSVHGGVQEQVLAMSRELSRRGHEVLVIAPDGTDQTRYETPATVARFGRLWSLPANGSRAPLTLSPLATRRAWFAAIQFRPDVVHFHEPFAPLVGWGILRVRRAPAVGTFHRSGDGPALRLTRPLLRSFARDLDVTTAVSESAASTIHRACGVAPEVLFNGFEMDRFVATPRERGGETVLVVIGRLEERKGVAHAIRAVRQHNDRGADQWRLVIVGDGPERARLEALAGHDDLITFTGAVDDAQKRHWLRRASAVVAPALRGESFGLVLLEAMASETPVVASDIDGYREAAGGHATLFTAANDGDLERAITRALTDETAASLQAALEHAAHWSMVTLMDRYEVLYEEARRRHRTAR